ncbi:beta-1,4-mannosyl-glycoprotein 4-beta-N-acetylglucosaminyltransferase-like isoform X2 [Artemia franciscana]|uniref:beta-1,4-mannosyl-glycoprotein 4-beta-N-acetylglucosaminyltransferase-like isoform X2 n=1 Tax=Artemia franciscana TaxID=6661 RepID=UPI0032DAED90
MRKINMPRCLSFQKTIKLFLTLLLIVVLAISITEVFATAYGYTNFYDSDKKDIAILFRLVDDERQYFTAIGNLTCFIEGTKLNESNVNCVCKNDYKGNDCGIPSSVFDTINNFYKPINLTRRIRPRRIINALNFNHETDLLESRLCDLEDVVDIFVICESNFTAYGDPKRLLLKEALNSNRVIERHSKKIMHILLDKMPSTDSGWIINRYFRVYMGHKSIPYIMNKRDDDLVILNDADEIPTREVLLFLKLYKGYPTPVKLGTIKHPAGFHCSWCLRTESIRQKMLAAHKDDKPRWGDFPNKTDLNYIINLIKTGEWFDGTKPLMRSYEKIEGINYAPRYILQNREKFQYLLYLEEK